jgi:MEDS: MEthanogen/methylotroph, DcmR Sensory domain
MDRFPPFPPSDQRAAALASLQWALGSPGHAVQFHYDDASSHEIAAQFLADGLRSGQPVIAIATPDHRRLFDEYLRAHAFDVDGLTLAGELGLHDAQEVVSRFMIASTPDPALFREVMGGILSRLGGRRRVIRIYGEIVDLLWKVGDREAALRVEELWNSLAADYHFALLCGYSIDNFTDAEHGVVFENICGQHHHVVATGWQRKPSRPAP